MPGKIPRVCFCVLVYVCCININSTTQASIATRTDHFYSDPEINVTHGLSHVGTTCVDGRRSVPTAGLQQYIRQGLGGSCWSLGAEPCTSQFDRKSYLVQNIQAQLYILLYVPCIYYSVVLRHYNTIQYSRHRVWRPRVCECVCVFFFSCVFTAAVLPFVPPRRYIFVMCT